MNAEQVLWSMLFLVVLLTAYGAQVGGDSSRSAIQGLTAPLPSIQSLYTNAHNCNWFDIACNAAQGVQATENIAAAIAYPFIVIFTLFSRVANFGNAIVNIVVGPGNTLAAVPFLIYPVLGLTLIVGFEVLRWIRGNASAGTM